jgi:hypothetical protein
MSVTIQTKLGIHTITVTGSDDKEAIEKLGCFGELPQSDPDGNPVSLGHRKAQGYDFYELRGQNGWRYALGQAKEGGRLFPKRDEGWQKYEGGKRSEDSPRPASRPAPAAQFDDDDSIPF